MFARQNTRKMGACTHELKASLSSVEVGRGDGSASPARVSDIHLCSGDTTLVSTAARTYSLKQLAVRAGVSRQWLQTWRIEHDPKQTIVYPVRDERKHRIIFPHASPEHWAKVSCGTFGATSFTNGSEPGELPSFIVPFAEHQDDVPLFRIEREEAHCSADLLASVVLTLSRFEETFAGPRDVHGRFPASSTLAAKYGYLCRPVVDELGLALKSLLTQMFPSWEPEPASFRVHLTHDVDDVGIPLTLRKFARYTIRGRSRSIGREFTRIFGALPSALNAVLDTVDVSAKYGLKCAVYWKASPPGAFDSGYDIEDPRVLNTIERLRDAGVELGVHPGYTTFLDWARLMEEVTRARRTIGNVQSCGGRQHFLRWSPQMWKEWEHCGLAYDSSLGFPDCIGFRAGTCHPYQPWLISENREAKLLEIPLIAMDCALTGPMELSGDECVARLLRIARMCRDVGGVFTLLWHPDAVVGSQNHRMYERVVRNLASYPSFDWQKVATNTDCSTLNASTGA